MPRIPGPISKKRRWIAHDQEGFTVVLETSCWYGHILRYHRSRMRHRMTDIKSTVEKSERIDKFTTGTVDNRVYWKAWEDRDPAGNRYLKVPTEVVDKEQKLCRVLTAHPVAFLPPPLKG